MPRIRIEPSGFEVETPRGLTVMDAAEVAGLYWPAGCDRKGECTNCAMDVISGVGRLSRMGRYERLNLVRQRGAHSVEDPRLRLACQAHVEGDIAVFKQGVASDGARDSQTDYGVASLTPLSTPWRHGGTRTT